MFQKADKRQGRLRLALTGPSGSGKTFSALLIATGIIEAMKKLGLDTGKGIAVIDTENGSALDYADRPEFPYGFDHCKIDPPYTIQKYLTTMGAAYAGGYAVVVVDSLSHAWAGEGGLLQKKEAMDSRGGNQYTNWAPITKEHEQLKAIILSNKIHLIAGMRSKQDYVVEENDKGKKAPRKVGMAPVQREGMEYEFTAVLDLGMDHSAHVSKDRTGLFDGQIFKPTKETGIELLNWRMSGKPEEAQPPAPAPTTTAATTKAAPPAADPKPERKKGRFQISAVTSYDRTDGQGKAWQVVASDDEGAMILKTSKVDWADLAQSAIEPKATVEITYDIYKSGNAIAHMAVIALPAPAAAGVPA